MHFEAPLTTETAVSFTSLSRSFQSPDSVIFKLDSGMERRLLPEDLNYINTLAAL